MPPETEQLIAPLIAHGRRNLDTGGAFTDEAGTHTIMSASYGDINPGRETLIPTVYDGRRVSDEEAIERAIASGIEWPTFATPEEATAASKLASDAMTPFAEQHRLMQEVKALPDNPPTRFTYDAPHEMEIAFKDRYRAQHIERPARRRSMIEDMGLGASRGVDAAGRSVAKLFGIYDQMEALEAWLGEHTAYKDAELPPTETVPGQLVEGFTQFLSLYGPLRALGGAAGATGFGLEMSAGGLADIAAFDPRDGNIATLALDLGIGEDNAFVQWLDSTSDSPAEGRIKNMVEGMLLGGSIEGAIRVFKHGIRGGFVGPPSGSPAGQRGAIGYHGSPHRFDEFKTSKIGTGEGALLPAGAAREKVEKIAEKVPGIRPLAEYLTPDEIAHLNTRRAQRMVDVFSQLPPAEEMASVAAAGSAKRGWYRDTAEAVHAVFGDDTPRFAQLLAAMSPQTSVENNLINAVNTWKNWLAAGRPVDRDSIIRIMGESVQGSKGEESVLPTWINNAVPALATEDPMSVTLSGPKVDSFWQNIIGETNEVTNDAWMANYAGIEQEMFAGSRNVAGTDPGKGGGYLAMSATARQAAEQLTARTGETWAPAEVQETVWSWIKGLYELRAGAGETRTAKEIVNAGELLDDIIDAVPEFGTMLGDPQYSQPLRDAGYGRELDELAAAVASRPGRTASAAASRAAAEPGDLDAAAARVERLHATRSKAKKKKRVAKTKKKRGNR